MTACVTNVSLAVNAEYAAPATSLSEVDANRRLPHRPTLLLLRRRPSGHGYFFAHSGCFNAVISLEVLATPQAIAIQDMEQAPLLEEEEEETEEEEEKEVTDHPRRSKRGRSHVVDSRCVVEARSPEVALGAQVKGVEVDSTSSIQLRRSERKSQNPPPSSIPCHRETLEEEEEEGEEEEEEGGGADDEGGQR